MANLVITAADVAFAGTKKNATAGAAITQGQAIYIDADDSKKAKLALAAGTAAQADCKGIALNSAGVGQPVAYATVGPITIGSVVVAGTYYFLSATPGAICPQADLVATNYITNIGFATTAALITIDLYATGVQTPA